MYTDLISVKIVSCLKVKMLNVLNYKESFTKVELIVVPMYQMFIF